MKKAVISGATGVIGTALINELIQNNVEVLVLCRRGSKRNQIIPDHPLVSKKYCVLSEFDQLKNDTEKGYDVFYHLAWEGADQQARNNIYLQNQNVRYALDAVGLAKRFGCNLFIGIGSQAEYGRFEGVLKPETPVHPDNAYGIGKLTAGLMTRELAHQINMRHIWVRAVSLYGPHNGPTPMVIKVMAKLMAGEVPALTKGEQMWEFLYSGDAARALYLLGEKGIDGKTYVLGSGDAKPLREFIEKIRDIVSPGAELGFGKVPYAERQVMYLCADISELEKDTGWKPETSFEQGIRNILQSETFSEL